MRSSEAVGNKTTTAKALQTAFIETVRSLKKQRYRFGNGKEREVSARKIARILQVSLHMVKKAIASPDTEGVWERKTCKNRKLEQMHLDFLTSAETLRKWRGFGLRDRCILFHRQFPDKFISFSKLR